MAGKLKRKAVNQLADTVSSATSEANRAMLRLAAEAVVKPGKAKQASKIMQLAKLFDEAADHLAQAHKTLFSEPDRTESAIEHLDSALACLKRVSPEGLAEPKKAKTERARSA